MVKALAERPRPSAMHLADGTPFDAASSSGTRQANVISWLREPGATSAKLAD